VLIRGGTYELSGQVVINGKGTAGAPVVVTGAPGVRPLFNFGSANNADARGGRSAGFSWMRAARRRTPGQWDRRTPLPGPLTQPRDQRWTPGYVPDLWSGRLLSSQAVKIPLRMAPVWRAPRRGAATRARLSCTAPRM